MVRVGALQVALTCHFSLYQVNFIDNASNSVHSQLRGFELRQISAGPQSPYIVEYLDQMALNRKLVMMLSPGSLKKFYHLKQLVASVGLQNSFVTTVNVMLVVNILCWHHSLLNKLHDL